MIEKGLKGKEEIIVTQDKTAKAYGSGGLEVFATPAMIAFIEYTALKSVEPFLEEGQSTVGTKVDVSHVSATPVGLKVSCETELTMIDRRRLVFSAKVYDSAGLIGQGIHERFIVDNEKFIKKTQEKI